MKIVEDDKVGVPFSDIPPGTIFVCEEVYYLKTFEADRDVTGYYTNSVGLETGAHEHFGDDVVVDSVPMSLKITQGGT